MAESRSLLLVVHLEWVNHLNAFKKESVRVLSVKDASKMNYCKTLK